MAVASGNSGFLEYAGSQLPMTFRFVPVAVLILCASGGGTPANTIPGDRGPARSRDSGRARARRAGGGARRGSARQRALTRCERAPRRRLLAAGGAGR